MSVTVEPALKLRPPPMREHVTPDGLVGSGVLGVYLWRMLGELQQPHHVRNSTLWARAMRAAPKQTIDAWSKELGLSDEEAAASQAVYERAVKLGDQTQH